ncbi:MAG: hypothetical protein ISS29_00525 [Candidatus Marinimicrobia bacterium]|nr:hypothetical protein [Candidatus Neomarinimicrobiota bacterium]
MCISRYKKERLGLWRDEAAQTAKKIYANDFLTINRGKIWTNYMKTDLKVLVFKKNSKKRTFILSIQQELLVNDKQSPGYYSVQKDV